MQKGTIAVQTENIFPIIKKFLYSDHEIFLREIIANAQDATSKLQVLAQRGEPTGELGDLTIQVVLDKKNNRLIIKDKGIGMTEEEVKKYLNQIAFSSAAEFLEKYKDSNIIGHFGLGFYSAFMVAKKVEVVTKSWQADEPAVKWTCEGNPEFTIEPVEGRDRGTDVILYIADEEKEFLEQHRLEELLLKYCKYLPVPIQFGKKTETYTVGEGSREREKSREVPFVINPKPPIWKQTPTTIEAQEYIDFYNEQYPAAADPLFWIHLNIDYPFNLTGVLYFPKIGNVLEVNRNKIHLYSNQVFVTDDVRNIVPEWLQLLHGVIDSPDIPLNVSRSYLQSDRNVKMISEYITKKVADKLLEIFKNDRADFEKKWKDIGVFIKYGMISEPKFMERAQAFALVENVAGKFFLAKDYREAIAENQTNKEGKVIALYSQNESEQNSYIKAAQQRGYDVLKMNAVLDLHWMQNLEYSAKLDYTFLRVDSDTVDNLIQKDESKTSILTETDEQRVQTIFENVAEQRVGANVRLSAGSPDDLPVTITRSEFLRRMREMNMLGGMRDEVFPDNYSIVVNTNHPIVAKKLLAEEDANTQSSLAQYLTDLAMLNQGMLKGADLTRFVERTLEKV